MTALADAYHNARRLTRKEKAAKREGKCSQRHTAQKSGLPEMPDNFLADLLARAQERDRTLMQRRVDGAAAKEMALLPRLKLTPREQRFTVTPILKTSKLALFPTNPCHRTKAHALSLSRSVNPDKYAQITGDILPHFAASDSEPQPPRKPVPVVPDRTPDIIREADEARTRDLAAAASQGLVSYFVRIMT